MGEKFSFALRQQPRLFFNKGAETNKKVEKTAQCGASKLKRVKKTAYVTKSGDDFEDLGLDGKVILKLIGK
jgi:hypothetical protein